MCPATLYGRAKLATASVLEAYGNPGGMSAAWARLFFLFGPHEHSSRLVPSLVNDLLSSKPARCRSATAVRDFLHVDDAARAIVALFNSDVSGPVNIGSGVPIVTGALARGVAAQLGRPEFVETDNSTGEAPFVVANVQRLREEVGWVPPGVLRSRWRKRSRGGHHIYSEGLCRDREMSGVRFRLRPVFLAS